MSDRYSVLEQKENAIEQAYREEFFKAELRNVIIFRSGPHSMDYVPGMDFADNARALFEYMLADGVNENYEIVWIVKDPDEYKHKYTSAKNVTFVSWDWASSEVKENADAYYIPLCTAKYIFFTDAYGFARNCRKDQIRVQLWHGCGFKTRVNFSRCENRYEYNTVISDTYAKIHQEIYGLREDQVLVTGQPKGDWLFNPIANWKEVLYVPEAKKYVFWLPTFRSTNIDMLNQYEMTGDVGLPAVSNVGQLNALNQLLAQNNTVLVIKLHPFQDTSNINVPKLSNIVLIENKQLYSNGMHINQLLGHADALISDYSSAAVDYLLLNRPVGFIIDDIDEYEQSRGFVFENVKDWMFGALITDYDALYMFVEEVCKGIDSTLSIREKIRKLVHKYVDDNSCKRIVDYFLNV